MHQAIWAANHCKFIDGDFVELGTGKGFIMQSVLASLGDWNKMNKTLWLYDTFLKFDLSGKGNNKHNKYYAENLESVKDYFKNFININFIEGNVVEEGIYKEMVR